MHMPPDLMLDKTYEEESKLRAESVVDWSNLRSCEYRQLLADLDKDSGSGSVPTLERVEGLICYWLEYKANDELDLPWPEELGIQEYANKGNVEHTEVTGQELYERINNICNRLGPEDLERLTDYVLDNFEDLTADLEDIDSDIHQLERLTISNIPWNSDFGQRVGGKLTEKMANFATTDGVQVNFAGKEWSFLVGMSFDDEKSENMRKIMYRALSSDETLSPEKKKLVMGLAMNNFEPSREYNTLREMMVDEKVSSEERLKTAKFLGQLLGLPDDAEVYPSLEKCYASMKFEKYPVSEYTTSIRERFLTDLVSKLKIGSNEKVLDIATGAGWLTEVLKRVGLRNSWGLDVNRKLLGIAKERLGNYFVASRWNKLPFATEQCALVTCLGRSLPHTENPIEFDAALSEMVRITKSGGTLVFDMPDSSMGTYIDAIEAHRNVMRSFGAEEEAVNNSWIIVDGPKGDKDHFYNRYAPSREIILDTLHSLDLEVDIVEEDIPDEKGNPSGDKNLVFVCKKP
ncbi:hypothetical protein COU88_03130 [Candidatus Roizmanbacteria bacterium CG10_big_fil_rev_8_21_14_0_10_39_6]|uniref:Methyltransferase type 11 domain-containing protein n=1 Tax=Candidatus Roizmanbacteria bacterium CG10_big_fil_rev_8_21_14_0_10_39_6 TaxID=1974853 RepID=A0A2M8KSA2_9BACT|nr:MAG: hypothetical protein COU88_03130 [Candidatus Roizmanbacteria bacterium CG10_big_fil_rev_8_21_14_0_10_39_6]